MVKMPKIRVNDVDLCFETHGAGSPLVLIARIIAPVLIMTGDDDPLFPPQNARIQNLS